MYIYIYILTYIYTYINIYICIYIYIILYKYPIVRNSCKWYKWSDQGNPCQQGAEWSILKRDVEPSKIADINDLSMVMHHTCHRENIPGFQGRLQIGSVTSSQWITGPAGKIHPGIMGSDRIPPCSGALVTGKVTTESRERFPSAPRKRSKRALAPARRFITMITMDYPWITHKGYPHFLHLSLPKRPKLPKRFTGPPAT